MKNTIPLITASVPFVMPAVLSSFETQDLKAPIPESFQNWRMKIPERMNKTPPMIEKKMSEKARKFELRSSSAL